MSDDLKAFLRAWLDWAEAGAPDRNMHTERNPNRFDSRYGLCENTHEFEELSLDVHPAETGGLEMELGSLFEEQGRRPSYPFGYEAYEDDTDACAHHLNPVRLAWVRNQLEA